MKLGREKNEVAQVFARDGGKCVICGLDLPWALAAHHKVPRELGGVDTASNLTTLCANCHRTVHWLMAGERLDGPEGERARAHLSKAGFDVLRELVETARAHKLRTKEAGHRWVVRPNTRDPISLDEALSAIERRNHLDPKFAAQQRSILGRVVSELGPNVLNQCAVRLVQNGRFLSINAGNILVFRVPGFPDGAKEPQGDFLLLWPRSRRLSSLSVSEWRKIAKWKGFASLPHAFDLDISLQEALAMTSADWGKFREVCSEAVAVGGTRRWLSNVSVSSEAKSGLTGHAPDGARLVRRRG